MGESINPLRFDPFMAKRRTVHKPKKMEPSELVFNFRLPATTGTPNTRQNIDLSQVASLVNRRFYRQGINWAVAGFTLHTTGIASHQGQLQIRKLPSTWTFANAWNKGFRVWDKMNREALEESPSVRPKFMDFKIYSDTAHHLNGYDENMLPFVRDAVGATKYADVGEWSPSKIYVPTGTGGAIGQSKHLELIGVGASYPGPGASTYDCVSLVEGYASSRGLPNIRDPNAPDDAGDADGQTPANWMAAIFNEGTEQLEEILEDMVGVNAENTIAPYPFENDGTNTDTQYPGGANQLPSLVLHDQMNVTGTTVGAKTSSRGGMFPCGLIQLNYNNELNDAIFQIHLVPGPHRGYLCQPMTEM